GNRARAYGNADTCWQRGGCLDRGMSHSEPARTAGRRTRSTVLAAVVVSAGLISVLGYQSLSASSSASSSTTSSITAAPLAPRPPEGLHGDHQGALGQADGVVPDGVTVFDDE